MLEMLTSSCRKAQTGEDRSVRLSAARLVAVERSLTNPQVRVALRSDFPPVLSHDEPRALLETLVRELARQGQTPDTVGEVTVVFPNKDPYLFLTHSNGKGETASWQTINAIKAAWKQVYGTKMPFKLNRCGLISETAHLNRSNNQQHVLHALEHRQQYVARRPLLGQTPSFLSADHASRQHYFIIADAYIEQGTTVANLASYLSHNGGHVLAAVHRAPSGQPLVADRALSLTDGFAAAAGQGKVLKALGRHLASAAGRECKDISPLQALEDIEACVNARGHSLAALTHAEMTRLMRGLRKGEVTYSALSALAENAHMTPVVQQQPKPLRR